MIFHSTGLELYYEAHGNHDGEPLLLLHGALGSLKDFKHLVGALWDRNCLLIDFPSHGGSAKSEAPSSTKILAKHCLSFLEHLGLRDVDIIGYSLGGYVAIEMALLRPQNVKSIISHAMKFFWTEEAITAAATSLDWSAISIDERRRQKLASAHPTAGAEEAVRMSREIIEAFRDHMLSLEDLQHLQTPLLLSVEDQDELVPLDEISKLYMGLGYEKTSLAVHPATRHPIQSLDPDLFSTSAHQFWAANSVTTRHEHANRTR